MQIIDIEWAPAILEESDREGVRATRLPTTMTISTIIFYAVARQRWGWSRVAAGVPVVIFLIVDLSFFGANISKILHGAWFPLVIGAVAFTLMERLPPSRRPGMRGWRVKLFGRMSRNALSATAFYHIPPNQAVENGAQLQL